MHDTLTVGLPILVILAGILFNRQDNQRTRDELRAEMNRRFDAMDRRFDVIEAELRYFHGVTGKLEGRIETICSASEAERRGIPAT